MDLYRNSMYFEADLLILDRLSRILKHSVKNNTTSFLKINKTIPKGFA